MHFTVSFRGSQTYGDDHSFGLVFVPCPVWVRGRQQLINLNPERPDYRPGSVRRLLEHEGLSSQLGEPMAASILVHPIGHGSVTDLNSLPRDLADEGFVVHIYGEVEAQKGPFSPKED